MNRVQYIDIMRGIAILLVVLQYCIGELEEPMSVFILSFHMPLFFFISGMCYKPDSYYSGRKKDFLLKRMQRLLVPQFFMGIYLILLSVGKAYVFEKGKTLLEIDFFGLLTYWFLPVIFVVELVGLIIAPVLKNRSVLFAVVSVVCCVFCVTEMQCLVCVEQILGGLLFFLLGFILRPMIENYATSSFFGGGLVLIVLVAVLSTYNLPIGMYVNQYGSKPLFTTIAILGITAIAFVSKMFKAGNVLNWFGRKSLEVYVLHWGLIMVFRKMIDLTIGESNSYPFYLVNFLLSCLLVVPLVIISDKFFPFLFGRFRTNKKHVSL